MGDVFTFKGGDLSHGAANENLIEVLEKVLERARAGEAVGAGVVIRHSDGCSSFIFGGEIGGYSMIGAAASLQKILIDVALDDD